MPRKIFLHLGAHKTASTFLHTNIKQQVAEQSITHTKLLSREEILRLNFSSELLDICRHDKKLDNPSAKATREISRIISSLEINANLLLLNEDMFQDSHALKFYNNIDEALEYLTQLFSSIGEIKIILYVRKQADYLESLYLQSVHLGRAWGFERYINRKDAFSIDWYALANAMSAHFGEENVKILPYELIKTQGSQKFYDNFLQLVDFEDSKTFKVSDKGRASNRSFSQKGVDMARKIFPMLEPEEKKKVRVFLQNHFSTADYPRAVFFSDEQRKELDAAYKERNIALFEKFMPQLNIKDFNY